jgi:hypothetical protein
MKKSVSLVLIIILIWAGTASANIGRDKYLHTGACATISFTTYSAMTELLPEMPRFYRALTAVSAAMLVGLGKEYIIDDKADSQDIVANFVGSILGIGVSFTIEW